MGWGMWRGWGERVGCWQWRGARGRERAMPAMSGEGGMGGEKVGRAGLRWRWGGQNAWGGVGGVPGGARPTSRLKPKSSSSSHQRLERPATRHAHMRMRAGGGARERGEGLRGGARTLGSRRVGGMGRLHRQRGQRSSSKSRISDFLLILSCRPDHL